MSTKPRQISFAVILFLFVIALLEVALGVLAFLSPQTNSLLGSPGDSSGSTPAIILDPRLGFRPNPAYPGHDRNGFRNPDIPPKPTIIALGDSQTYGTSVEPDDPWPRQLERTLGTSVYSMAFGGYGPTHSLVLWDDAVAMKPATIIEAFYVGNDFFDAFNHVYNNGQLPEFKNDDSHVQERVRAEEQAEPIEGYVTRMFRMGAPVGTSPATPASASLVRSILQHSNIFSLVRRAKYELVRIFDTSVLPTQDEWEKAKAFAAAHPAYCQVFADTLFKTVFTSEYRIAALNLDDPRITEGLRIALRAIKAMQERAIAQHVRFIVIMIPTKEAVFGQRWKNPSESFLKLAGYEERAWKTIEEFLDQNGIEHLDALPALREQLTRGIQPYLASSDGHPNRHGHAALANLVATYLQQSNASSAQPKHNVSVGTLTSNP